MILATVYKSGGDFDIRYVESLVYQLRNYGGYKGAIHCLTDRIEEVAALGDPKPIQLKHDWPGWWSKIELFRPGLFRNDVLYLDLDTFIFDEILKLVKICQQNERPLFLRGTHPRARQNNWLASGMMAWKGNQLSAIYNAFMDIGPKRAVKEQKDFPAGAGQKGDQGFIRRVLGDNDHDFFQGLALPNKYIMFKRHVIIDKKNTEGCHVLCWSGSSRPHLKSNPFNGFWGSCLKN